MNYRVENDPENGYGLIAQGEIEGDPLDESIRKWEFIVQWVTENRAYLYDGGIDTCGLCLSRGCLLCPVRASTKKLFCQGTPYSDYTRAKRGTALETAKAELAFLESLKEMK